ncbi:MAG: polysaccharide deacetylase family protein [Candidatus Didemnitutus sp.]|nr:polysaccharide deacetylase family protein [Candidatus Didemnitutus sp.]
MNPPACLALKIDVDTDRGTAIGVPNLVADLAAAGAPATFFFSLGPDNTGRAITRVFRPGFLRKVGRTSVLRNYGLRTLLNGTLLPAPDIGRRHAATLRNVAAAGFETGIHCHDHYRWQDHLHRMPRPRIAAEFQSARTAYTAIFGAAAIGAAAPGWQCNADSRAVYDEAALLYGSDTRGSTPFFPWLGTRAGSALEIPTTLPTLDELLGRPEFPEHRLAEHLLAQIAPGQTHVFTLHAELEGMRYRGFFRELLAAVRARGIHWTTLERIARAALTAPAQIPICPLEQREIDGRSGLVATQGLPLEIIAGRRA